MLVQDTNTEILALKVNEENNTKAFSVAAYTILKFKDNNTSHKLLEQRGAPDIDITDDFLDLTSEAKKKKITMGKEITIITLTAQQKKP